MCNRQKSLLFIAMVLAAAVYITGCGKADKAGGPPPQQAITVEVSRVEKSQVVRTVTLSGIAAPAAQVDIVPKVGGRVERINFKIGDGVKKGDVIIQLEQADALNQLKQAEAGLAAARANLNMLKSGQLPGQLAQSEANYQNAKANFERMQQLYNQGAVSRQQYEAAELQYTVAKSQYETLMATMPENLQAAEAQVKQAEAAYSLAKSAYENTRLTSPVDGIVSMIAPEVGELVGPGTPAATVVNLDTVVIDVNVSEAKINSFKRGDELEVFINSASELPLKGVVTELSPAADPRTKTFLMKIAVKNERHIIKGGMFATVKAAINKKDGVLAVPKEALIERESEYYVFTAEGDRAKLQKVTVGLMGDESAEIVEGLSSGDMIVVVGQDVLEDNDLIKLAGRGESR